MATEGLLNLFTTQFSTTLELKLQQMSSKLRGKVREGFHVGKQASPVNQMNAISLRSPAGRFSPLGNVVTDYTRRWVFPQDGELPQLIDSFDELKTIVDPKSQFAENAAAAVGRAWDDSVIQAALGTAFTGVDASSLASETWASFSSAYTVASTFGSSAASGLTVAKIIEAKRLFRHNQVDLETDPVTLIIGSQQESDLLNQVQVVSTEFNDRPVLVDGKITRFLGFDIVYSERLSYASSVRKVIAFSKSGMYLGMWKDMTNRVSIRNDLSGEPYQLYTATSYGSTRTQPGKVVEIDCSDTTLGDITP
jgi:hypothetical protein